MVQDDEKKQSLFPGKQYNIISNILWKILGMCADKEKAACHYTETHRKTHYAISIQIIIKNITDNRILSKRKRAGENGRETLFKEIHERNE